MQGLTSCIDCPIGTYIDKKGQSACLPCNTSAGNVTGAHLVQLVHMLWNLLPRLARNVHLVMRLQQQEQQLVLGVSLGFLPMIQVLFSALLALQEISALVLQTPQIICQDQPHALLVDLVHTTPCLLNPSALRVPKGKLPI